MSISKHNAQLIYDTMLEHPDLKVTHSTFEKDGCFCAIGLVFHDNQFTCHDYDRFHNRLTIAGFKFETDVEWADDCATPFDRFIREKRLNGEPFSKVAEIFKQEFLTEETK